MSKSPSKSEVYAVKIKKENEQFFQPIIELIKIKIGHESRTYILNEYVRRKGNIMVRRSAIFHSKNIK